MSSRISLLIAACLLFFGFFYNNRRSKRTRRPNSTAAHSDRQLNSDRFRLRKQHLGRAARRRQRATADEFSGTDCESTFLT